MNFSAAALSPARASAIVVRSRTLGVGASVAVSSLPAPAVAQENLLASLAIAEPTQHHEPHLALGDGPD